MPGAQRQADAGQSQTRRASETGRAACQCQCQYRRTTFGHLMMGTAPSVAKAENSPSTTAAVDACDRLQASEQQQSRNVWDVGCQCRPGAVDLQQLASSCEGCRVPGVPLFACLWQQGR